MNKRTLHVTVVYSPLARVVHEVALTLEAPCTVGAAIVQSCLGQGFPEMEGLGTQAGVWGRKVALHHLLRDLDRVEIYRPLRVDPKVARRERFVKQGARSAGLFAKKRLAGTGRLLK